VVAGKLVIDGEGTTRKFVDAVEHRTFSGPYAALAGKEVLYITERCVLGLTAKGLQLLEIAPGVDLQRDVLAHMDFAPIVEHVKAMDEVIFSTAPMNLREILLRLPLESRFSTTPTRTSCFSTSKSSKSNRCQTWRRSGATLRACASHLDARFTPSSTTMDSR
jgi:propionate CoA-transferase